MNNTLEVKRDIFWSPPLPPKSDYGIYGWYLRKTTCSTPSSGGTTRWFFSYWCINCLVRALNWKKKYELSITISQYIHMILNLNIMNNSNYISWISTAMQGLKTLLWNSFKVESLARAKNMIGKEGRMTYGLRMSCSSLVYFLRKFHIFSSTQFCANI